MYKQLQITFRNTEDATTKNIVWDIRDFNLAQKWAKALQTDYLETDAKIEKQAVNISFAKYNQNGNMSRIIKN